MAYQQVSTPRFYVDHGLLYHTLGSYDFKDKGAEGDAIIPFIQLNPTSTQIIGLQADGTGNYLYVPRLSPINYCAFLGHSGTNKTMYPVWKDTIGGLDVTTMTFGGVNTQTHSTDSAVEYSGFSIFTFPDKEHPYLLAWKADPATSTMGAMSVGSYYDMKNAPNLSLTMSRDYGGTKEFTTYNGSSMSNTMFTGSPKWGDLGAWELGDGVINQNLARSGRRSWNLKFSFMGDSDLWGSNQSLSTYLATSTGYEGQGVLDPDGDIHTVEEDDGSLTDEGFNYNLLTDYNFFSQVWQKTLGGTLPFIFQPDKDNNNPDQFAICKFKQNSLKATQSAFNVYDISLIIEEVW